MHAVRHVTLCTTHMHTHTNPSDYEITSVTVFLCQEHETAFVSVSLNPNVTHLALSPPEPWTKAEGNLSIFLNLFFHPYDFQVLQREK